MGRFQISKVAATNRHFPSGFRLYGQACRIPVDLQDSRLAVSDPAPQRVFEFDRRRPFFIPYANAVRVPDGHGHSLGLAHGRLTF